jgi:hypothetical protein
MRASYWFLCFSYDATKDLISIRLQKHTISIPVFFLSCVPKEAWKKELVVSTSSRDRSEDGMMDAGIP